ITYITNVCWGNLPSVSKYVFYFVDISGKIWLVGFRMIKEKFLDKKFNF
ncbi:hypothetical protein SAMN02745136_05792, partial [Anaerocolumna jejuensis DSM 15929]